jgi:hypothetical protein
MATAKTTARIGSLALSMALLLTYSGFWQLPSARPLLNTSQQYNKLLSVFAYGIIRNSYWLDIHYSPRQQWRVFFYFSFLQVFRCFEIVRDSYTRTPMMAFITKGVRQYETKKQGARCQSSKWLEDYV